MKAKIYLDVEEVWLEVLSISFDDQMVCVSREEVYQKCKIKRNSLEEYNFMNTYSGHSRSTAGLLFFLQLFYINRTLIIE